MKSEAVRRKPIGNVRIKWVVHDTRQVMAILQIA